jgi:hypothetical protein
MKPAKTQEDRNMNFDGMENMAPSRSSRYKTNAWSGHMNDGRLVNKGRGPTVGNHGCENPARPGASTSVTGDPYHCPPVTSLPKLPAQGSVRDNINRGAQVRNPGGTRDWMPSAGQNYRGNPDAIRAKQTGGPGYGAVTKSRTPATSRGESNFNYGPKSQY